MKLADQALTVFCMSGLALAMWVGALKLEWFLEEKYNLREWIATALSGAIYFMIVLSGLFLIWAVVTLMIIGAAAAVSAGWHAGKPK